MTSQINPNNIDGNYPIAGVSNNTQGMRDNFTNIKQNFQYAENEIDDLQNNVLLKAALTGTTLDNNLGNNLIYNAQIRGFSGTLVQIANTSGSITVDCSAGHLQTIAMAGNISVSFTTTTWPAAGLVGLIRLKIIVDTAGRTMTLPSAVGLGTTGIQGYSANVITFATAGTFEFGFLTYDQGTTITLFDLNRPLSYYTNDVTIAANTVSTSTTSGALTVAGGIGVAGNLYVGGDIFGNVTVTDISVNTVTAVGNVVGGNIRTGGLISATGNITGGNITGAANVNSTTHTGTTVSVTGNITGGNILGGANVNATTHTGTTVSVTGNITGGNILGGANVNATTHTGTTVSVTGNITGGNILGGANVNATTHTGTTVSVTGNITGGNVLGGANVNATTHTGTTVSVTANITGGNVLFGSGIVSGTGNVTGGNVLFGSGIVSGTGNVTGGNVLSAAVISAVGNATILSGTAIPVGGTAGAGYKMSSTANLGIFFGSGAPTLNAAKGSLYLRTDGTTTTTRMYVNTDGAAAWTNVVTSA